METTETPYENGIRCILIEYRAVMPYNVPGPWRIHEVVRSPLTLRFSNPEDLEARCRAYIERTGAGGQKREYRWRWGWIVPDTDGSDCKMVV